MQGMEMHMVNQMQNIPGGIGRMMEHWIKQYHQIGYQFDVAYCRVAANARARSERRTSNHQVKMHRQHLEAKHVGSKKSKATNL
jgi:hypothetical protein